MPTALTIKVGCSGIRSKTKKRSGSLKTKDKYTVYTKNNFNISVFKKIIKSLCILKKKVNPIAVEKR